MYGTYACLIFIFEKVRRGAPTPISY